MKLKNIFVYSLLYIIVGGIFGVGGFNFGLEWQKNAELKNSTLAELIQSADFPLMSEGAIIARQLLLGISQNCNNVTIQDIIEGNFAGECGDAQISNIEGGISIYYPAMELMGKEYENIRISFDFDGSTETYIESTEEIAANDNRNSVE